jgi:hypothetical protein
MPVSIQYYRMHLESILVFYREFRKVDKKLRELIVLIYLSNKCSVNIGKKKPSFGRCPPFCIFYKIVKIMTIYKTGLFFVFGNSRAGYFRGLKQNFDITKLVLILFYSFSAIGGFLWTLYIVFSVFSNSPAYSMQVLLYPEEGWARSAMSSYWILAPCWWSWSRCKVIEVTGTRR